MINEGMNLGEQLSLASTLTIFPDNIKSISTLIDPLQGCETRISTLIHPLQGCEARISTLIDLLQGYKPRISTLIHTNVKYVNT